ncbi:MAG: extracellular solute-binding protein, partial [Candidatus Gracilibacteria bacterium]|nr:extracellular solute-binding protein [Candidatus Gracilibacteria bacterium]
FQASVLQNKAPEIHFWGIYDLPDIYNPIIDAFQKQHPRVKIFYKQFPNTEEYHQVLLAQLEKGRGPDIFLFSDQNKDQYWPYLTPTTAELSEGFTPIAKRDFISNRLLYALPYWVDSLMLYYNKRYYPEGVPTQWYDLAELSRTLSTGGIAMGRFDNLKSGWDILKTLFLQKDIKLEGKPENSLYDTLEFFTRFAYPIDRYFNWNEKLSKDYPDLEIDSFVRKKVAAIAGYPSLYYHLLLKIDQLEAQGMTRIKKEDIGVSTFPQFDPENPDYLAKYMAIGVSMASENTTLSWEFIRALTSENNSAYYQQVTGRTPGRILPVHDEESEMTRVQKEQLINSSTLQIKPEAVKIIEDIVKRGVLDKRVLLEILNVENLNPKP